jgi:hypothetical protein
LFLVLKKEGVITGKQRFRVGVRREHWRPYETDECLGQIVFIREYVVEGHKNKLTAWDR